MKLEKQCPATHSRIDRAGPSFREHSKPISGRQRMGEGRAIDVALAKGDPRKRTFRGLLHPVVGTASENDWQGLHREMCAHGRHR